MGRYSKQRPFAPFQKLLAGLGDQESSAFVKELNALAAAVAELSAEGQTSPDVPTGDSFNIKLGTKKFPEVSTNEMTLVVSPPLTGSLVGDKLTLGASIPTTDAVKTVSTDGAVPTGPFSVTGAGTVVLVEGANVTLTATQPSPGVVEVEVAAAGGGGGASNVVKLSAAQLDSGSVTESASIYGRQACALVFSQLSTSNTPASARRCLPHPGGVATTYDPLVWAGTPPTGWTGNVIVRLFGWVGAGSVTPSTTFVQFYARIQVQEHGQAITTFDDGTPSTVVLFPATQNEFFEEELTAALPSGAPTTGCTVVVECGRQVGDTSGAALSADDLAGNVFVEGVDIEFEV